jgi:hypothetical protein
VGFYDFDYGESKIRGYQENPQEKYTGRQGFEP